MPRKIPAADLKIKMRLVYRNTSGQWRYSIPIHHVEYVDTCHGVHINYGEYCYPPWKPVEVK